MITEPFIGREGAIKNVPIRRKKTKKSNIEIGESYLCYPRDDESWKYPFIGKVEKILTNTAVVRIIATQQEDDHLIDRLNYRTVVVLTRMVPKKKADR
ncbi:hypothetical protein [Enterococcus sp. AZ109]|uniref:hypothetical protein n=1 Tax=Enterococcus sp. AZ109 TaxID=2774634 RepID=UPI003F201F37